MAEKEEIQRIIDEKIVPIIIACSNSQGGIIVVDISGDTVSLKFKGVCSTCYYRFMTRSTLIPRILRKHIPGTIFIQWT